MNRVLTKNRKPGKYESTSSKKFILIDPENFSQPTNPSPCSHMQRPQFECICRQAKKEMKCWPCICRKVINIAVQRGLLMGARPHRHEEKVAGKYLRASCRLILQRQQTTSIWMNAAPRPTLFLSSMLWWQKEPIHIRLATNNREQKVELPLSSNQWHCRKVRLVLPDNLIE